MPEPNEEPASGNNEGTDPASIRKALKEEVVNELVGELSRGDKDSPVYKGLQRVIASKDQQIQSLQMAQQALAQQMQAGFTSLSTEDQFLSAALIRNLPSAEQERIQRELSARKQAALEAQVRALQQPKPPVPQYPQVPDPYEEQLKAARAEAEAVMRESVKEYGLDPDDKSLDYGSQDEVFAQRFKKLNSSIAKALKAKDDAVVAGVRQTVPMTPSRTGGGSSSSGSGAGFGRGTLSEGANEVLERIRNPGTSARKK